MSNPSQTLLKTETGSDDEAKKKKALICCVLFIVLVLVIVLPITLTLEKSSGSTCSPLVLLFYVDPPSVYSGITNRVNLYVSGLNASNAQGIQLRGPNTINLNWNFASNTSQSLIVATVPEGTPEGTYVVRVTNEAGCYDDYNSITVVSDVTLFITSVNPAFVWTEVPTPINVQINQPAFLPTPRVYLNSDATNFTYTLQSVIFGTSASIDATLPAGLAVGVYDVIVINPDGKLGVALAAVTVTVNAPPVVLAAQPSSLLNNGNGRVTLYGTDLLNANFASLTCPLTNGVTVNATAITVISPQQIDVTFPVGSFSGTAILCSLTVYFQGGMSYRYSTLSIRGSSGNIASWVTQAPRFNYPRRAPNLVTGAPLASTRLLYVVGGDQGSNDVPQQNNTIRAIESAVINEDGTLSNFTVLPSLLPTACAFGGGVTISSYIYVICGYDGTNNQVSAKTYRAQVLSPLLSPTFTVYLDIQDGPSNLTAGTWSYTISSVYSINNTANPGGESIAAPIITFSLPNYGGLVITLSWENQTNAVAYNIYRSPTANGNPNYLLLIGTTNGTSFVDTGIPPISNQQPLVTGALGSWSNLPQLNTARQKFATAVVQDTVNTSLYTVFVFGGSNAAGQPLASYEYIQVTVTLSNDTSTPELQAVTNWMTGSTSLSVPRYGLGAVVTSQFDNSVVAPGDQWIYVGAGMGQSGVATVQMDAAKYNSNGVLNWVTDSSLTFQNDAIGYAIGKANNFLWYTGGKNNAPSPQSVKSVYCTTVSSQCTTVPPDLEGFSSFGQSTNENRWYPGGVASQVFLFIGGGANNGAASSTVEEAICCR